jgi:hypothetical protein
MPKGKGKRNPGDKLATLIKKQVNHRSDPSTCSNCKYAVNAPSVDGVEPLLPLTCVKHEQLTTFGVALDETCDAWEKKRAKKGGGRKKKEEAAIGKKVDKKANKKVDKKGKKKVVDEDLDADPEELFGDDE